jgi:hypothetical protein
MPSGPDPAGREEDVEAATGAEVEDVLTRGQLGEGGGVAAAEGGCERGVERGVGLVVEVGGDGVDSLELAALAAAARRLRVGRRGVAAARGRRRGGGAAGGRALLEREPRRRGIPLLDGGAHLVGGEVVHV